MADLPDLDDGTYTAVVDSVEDGLATVFFEADGTEVGSAVLDAAALPEPGREADAVVTARVEDGAVVEWTADAEATADRAERAQSRFDRLSSRPPSDDDERD